MSKPSLSNENISDLSQSNHFYNTEKVQNLKNEEIQMKKEPKEENIEMNINPNRKYRFQQLKTSNSQLSQDETDRLQLGSKLTLESEMNGNLENAQNQKRKTGFFKMCSNPFFCMPKKKPIQAGISIVTKTESVLKNEDILDQIDSYDSSEELVNCNKN